MIAVSLKLLFCKAINFPSQSARIEFILIYLIYQTTFQLFDNLENVSLQYLTSTLPQSPPSIHLVTLVTIAMMSNSVGFNQYFTHHLSTSVCKKSKLIDNHSIEALPYLVNY